LSERRKICVVVGSRANYARIKSVLAAVDEREDLELQTIAAASTLLERFGTAVDVMERDGFPPSALIRLIIEGETPTTMAKSTGLGLLELPTVFEMLEPDIVVTVADRFETIATTVAAAYMNLPVAHTQGGEISGSIDESVRHAVTKLSHLHFPATELSARRVVAMGEDPATVFPVGCPSIDLVAQTDLAIRRDTLAAFGGAGSQIDPERPFILVVQHPVTTEYGQGLDQIRATLDAVASMGMQALVFWPNVDAGSEDVAKGIREFRERGRDEGFHFLRNLPPEMFIKVMAHCTCMVGNSSAALREGAFLGTPAVSVGTRQRGRESGANVVWTENDASEIASAMRDQIAHGPYDRDELFGDGSAGTRIAEVLTTARPSIQKRLSYDLEELRLTRLRAPVAAAQAAPRSPDGGAAPPRDGRA
jgi:UDP-hydrolysing UDP-N-acetyl-D-glucosamine 2-epimerase